MSYDVLVIGAGSGGGVLAARLSEDATRRVCLVEAGPDFPDEEARPPSFATAGAQFAHQPVPEHDWNFTSEPVQGDRRLWLPRGKLVGGSSMTNGTMCVRGAPDDFARWVERGAEGWGWDDVLPFYERAEAELSPKRYPRAAWQPVQTRFHDALVGLGYRPTEDMLAAEAWHGAIGPTPFNRRNEVRQGTLVTYVRAARSRPNFALRPDTLVDRVLVEGGRARGVLTAAGERPEADLVVLCAGVYGSAAILLRSGIGPGGAVADLPVGERLLDHGVIFFRLHAPELADVCSPGSSVFARAFDNAWFAVAMTIDEVDGVCGVAFVSTGDGGGSVELGSDDPAAAPRIRHVYDEAPFESAAEVYRELLARREFAGARDLDAGRSLRELLDERLNTAYHAAGTCPIGPVVDPRLRVHGVDGLAVADASVFPAHVSNNTNLTCFMVGERAADLLGT